VTAQLESGNRTVLIVDDDPIYRQVLAMGLEAAGYRTVAAENGERAVEIVNEAPPDIILLDMLMPVMDGMQFLRWAKEKAPTRIPTLVLTCLDRRTVAVDALVAGAAEVLTKPFSLPALLKKLSTIG
jgi:CheY-like chemotaxis protein